MFVTTAHCEYKGETQVETQTHRSSNNLLKSQQRHCGAELRRRHGNRDRPHSNTDTLLTAHCCLVPFRHTRKATSIIGSLVVCLFVCLFGWLLNNFSCSPTCIFVNFERVAVVLIHIGGVEKSPMSQICILYSSSNNSHVFCMLSPCVCI